MKILLFLLFLLLAAYGLLIIFAIFFSDEMIFPKPAPSYRDNPSIIKLKTLDGCFISAVYLPSQKSKYVFLVSHGNAEDIGHIRPFLEAINEHGFSAFAYDYHGYGTSAGSSSEKAAYQDIDASYDYLIQKLHYAPDQIIAYGRSLGTAAAIDLASRKPVGGLIVESPFVTAFRVMTYIPILPFDKFNNLKKIRRVHAPLLVIHGSVDKLIPIWHGRTIFEAANASKQFFVIPNYDHNDSPALNYPLYWLTITQFINANMELK